MKTVPLYGAKAAGKVALVDDADYALVMRYRWNAVNPSGNCWYPITNLRAPRRRAMLMHMLITGWPLTDHRNHDGLDNQRGNLRPATWGQNLANQRGGRSAASPYKGVALIRSGKWRARIKRDGKTYHLGVFALEEDAARAYDAAALAAWGEYACLNFPEFATVPTWRG